MITYINLYFTNNSKEDERKKLLSFMLQIQDALKSFE